MTDNTKTSKELQIIKENAVAGEIISDALSLEKPQQDTQFAQAAANYLVDIIKKNNWSKKLGGQSEHIQYEGWQTAGKFYGYTVKTFDAEFIKFDDTWGFKAKAIVVNERTGIEVGGAEALCMSDEMNWKSKPKFQLASMAQTRAGSKALRQILGFVVALAGYSATPAEEMTGDEHVSDIPSVKKMPSTQSASDVCEICHAKGKYHRPDCPNKE